MVKVASWNITKRTEPWRQLASMAQTDVALLQEGGSIPPDVAGRIKAGGVEHWDSHVWNSRWYDGRFPNLFDRWPMVVQLSDRVEVEWFKQVSPISEVAPDEIAVSGIGTIAVARITPRDSRTEPFIVVSMYARWIKPHPSTRSNWGVGFPDGSAHRIRSDLSAFIGDTDPNSHRILAAGDLNMVYGCVPDDPQSLATRERSVFDRFEALGMRFMGPQYPSGRRAHSPPHGLPPDTRNVPTFHTTTQSPETAHNQLDYVFASRGFHESLTVRALNSVTLRLFFGSLQKAPDQVSPQDVFSFAHGIGLSGREPSPVTVGARLSCISSFFKFLIRMDVVKANPCDSVERPKPRPGAPSGLSAAQVQQLLQVIPDTLKGRRDLAIVLTLVLTGRRRSEVVNLTAGDIAFDDSAAFYRYLGKGGLRGRRELPRPALAAIVRSLADVGKDLSQMHPSESLWQAGAGPQGVSSATFYNRFRGYLAKAGLPPSGVHVLRHTAAKLRRDIGESVESVSQFLDHSSLAVTTTYLRRLEGERDTAWHGVASVIGVS